MDSTRTGASGADDAKRPSTPKGKKASKGGEKAASAVAPSARRPPSAAPLPQAALATGGAASSGGQASAGGALGGSGGGGGGIYLLRERDQIEVFAHKELVPSGNRVLVTSHPEGIRLSTCRMRSRGIHLSNEKQGHVINIQMQGNIFFDHLFSLGEVRKALDDAYRRTGALTRGKVVMTFMPRGGCGGVE